jgi:hypothetical protein
MHAYGTVMRFSTHMLSEHIVKALTSMGFICTRNQAGKPNKHKQWII